MLIATIDDTAYGPFDSKDDVRAWTKRIRSTEEGRIPAGNPLWTLWDVQDPESAFESRTGQHQEKSLSSAHKKGPPK